MTTQRQVCRVPAGSLCWYLSRGPLTACLCTLFWPGATKWRAQPRQAYPDKPGKPALAGQFACLSLCSGCTLPWRLGVPPTTPIPPPRPARGRLGSPPRPFPTTRGTRCARRQCMRHEVSLVICHFLSPVLAVFFSVRLRALMCMASRGNDR